MTRQTNPPQHIFDNDTGIDDYVPGAEAQTAREGAHRQTGDATAPPDGAQRKRDEAMEAAWCAGIPKLLAELAARGIDTRKLRELDAGAVPVQVVKPETIDAILREKESAPRTQAAPQTLARPLK